MLRQIWVGSWAVAILLVFAWSASADASGDANVSACTNESLEGFRIDLPDCRAYEMVTPVFKEGAKVAVEAVSSDGSQVLANSLGAFAGTEGDADFTEGAIYLLTRSSQGWEASSVTPPVSRFPAQLYRAASPDAEASLWLMRTPAQSQYAEDAYVREADGSFVRLGPLIPPSAEQGPAAEADEFFYYNKGTSYAAASDNLSHALFELQTSTPLWPNDTTFVPSGATQVNRSLYESVEGASRPELVGVESKGNLISDCETDLGSVESQDVYNAMSTDGGTVFFTAATDASGSCPGNVRAPEVNELYARIGGIETVPISEPSASACPACDVPATLAEGRMDAEFAGASEGGSKVFFLTEQALLGSDTSMNLYEYDLGASPGEKVVRVSVATGGEAADVQGVARVSEDGSHVYFVARGVLTSGPNVEGREPMKGADNLYIYERDAAYPAGRLAFVATLCSGPGESGTVSLAQCPSTSAADEQGDFRDWMARDSRPVEATPDGRYLVFESVADLTPGDTSSQPQIFEYDAQTGELARVSTGEAGYAAGLANSNASASTIVVQKYLESVSPSEVSRLMVSNDGATVVFESAGALTPMAEPAAAAGAVSVYEYRSNGAIKDGNVFLISDGLSTRSSELLGLDASGNDIFFKTAASLVKNDTDTQEDVYDARVDGGFPVREAALPCEGETCLGSAAGLPVFGPPGSATVIGPVGVVPTDGGADPSLRSARTSDARCPVGPGLRRGRCVRRRESRAASARVGRGGSVTRRMRAMKRRGRAGLRGGV
ncbi:MAG TPA: hypothetical protein VNV42_07315 [Solirubrobacteraceae bacterium]|jgi:hypothetical protein|nr:hypothetical protein [Solirubrobacteraceae bacterium]